MREISGNEFFRTNELTVPKVISHELKVYYTYCISFYLYGVITTLIDEHKKDFVAMLLHHIVTIGLIYMSACGNMHRIGAVIMLTFDICDILLEAATISHRVKFEQVSI